MKTDYELINDDGAPRIEANPWPLHRTFETVIINEDQEHEIVSMMNDHYAELQSLMARIFEEAKEGRDG